jgi:hypothetical protein
MENNMCDTRDTTAMHKTSTSAGLPIRSRKLTLLLVIAGNLAGCDPVSLTAFGVGSSAGIEHTLSGISYRTFTASLPKVRSATQTALAHMGIKVQSKEKIDHGEVIRASATGRDIEVTLESLTPNTTRMRSIVRDGVLFDAATATEIVLQTEKVLPGAS